MKQTVAQRAKELLIPIPKEEFITTFYSDGEGKCCAFGHLNRLTKGNPDNYKYISCSKGEIEKQLRLSSQKYLNDNHNTVFSDLASVNNSDLVNGYTEDNPKDRVIHLLDDMIKAGY